MQDFRRLVVWQQAHAVAIDVYRIASAFPPRHRFGLASQMERAAASVGANVAEGCGRRTPADMRRFLAIALGSADELLNHLLIARDLGLVPGDSFRDLERRAFQIRRGLLRLMRRLDVYTSAR